MSLNIFKVNFHPQQPNFFDFFLVRKCSISASISKILFVIFITSLLRVEISDHSFLKNYFFAMKKTY